MFSQYYRAVLTLVALGAILTNAEQMLLVVSVCLLCGAGDPNVLALAAGAVRGAVRAARGPPPRRRLLLRGAHMENPLRQPR